MVKKDSNNINVRKFENKKEVNSNSLSGEESEFSNLEGDNSDADSFINSKGGAVSINGKINKKSSTNINTNENQKDQKKSDKYYELMKRIERKFPG
jgi:hypothetical protein